MNLIKSRWHREGSHNANLQLILGLHVYTVRGMPLPGYSEGYENLVFCIFPVSENIQEDVPSLGFGI